MAETKKGNETKTEDIFQQIRNRMVMEYPFIFCVSRAKNDAAQWDRYANGGKGVAIVFNTKNLFKLLYYNYMIFNEEYYGYNAKIHKMCNLLVEYINEGNLSSFSRFDGVIDNLFLCAMLHKHESFAPEQEVRISPYFVKEDDVHIQFKIGNTIKRVYVLELDKLCVKENIVIDELIDSIVIGSTSHQNIEDLKRYCKNIGLDSLANKIVSSDCPLIRIK